MHKKASVASFWKAYRGYMGPQPGSPGRLDGLADGE